MLTVRDDSGEHRVRITEATKIWLDRTSIKRTNEGGSRADCKQGRQCEIKYAYDGGTRTDRAEWIKIRVSGSD